MDKLQMKTPLVEMDGDEMTRILWQQIKEELLEPYIDLKTEYYDLGLPHREETGDQVTIDAAQANKKYGVAVKCATITPNAQRVEEYKLSQMWKSPNGTIRAILDGTVFRAPIMVKGLNPVVKNWQAPITIARHAFGDVYKAAEYKVPGPGKAELVFTASDGAETRQTIHQFDGPGVLQGQFNMEASITSFAHSCFQFALDTRQDLWFSTKDTISKQYDHTFKDIFAAVYEEDYKAKFEQTGITYFYTLIDDAELRRRRDERHGVHRLRLAGHDDLRAGVPRRQLRVRGRPRHRHPALLPPPERGAGIHQPHGHPVRLDRGAGQTGRAGRPAGADCFRPEAGKGRHRHH